MICLQSQTMKTMLLIMVALLLPAVASADPFSPQRCVNMGNALDAPNEGEWGHTIDLKSFAEIRSAGFDTVRIPVRWSAHIDPRANNKIDAVFLARVDQVVGAALAADLSVVLNVHHFERLMERPRAHMGAFLDIWAQLAPHYQALSPRVSFEVINEPNGEMRGDIMRRLQLVALQVIRATNPTRTIILGGEDWSNVTTLGTNLATKDPNIVYTFHYYDPFDFTHQKAPWAGPNGPKKRRGWGSNEDRETLKEHMATARAFSQATGRPIFLGEFGAYERAPEPDRLAYIEAVRREAEAAGIGWCIWNYTGSFPIYDTRQKQWTPGHLEALGLSAR